MCEHKDADSCAGNVQCHLHHVGPDDGGHSPLEGVDQGQNHDDGDGKHIVSADRDADDDRNGEHADAFGSRAEKQEKKGCELVQPGTEALTDDLVGGEKFSAEIAWEKDDAHYNSSQKIAEDDLEKSPVSCIGQSGHADDGQGAGFRSHDGERDGPPGNLAIGQEVAF